MQHLLSLLAFLFVSQLAGQTITGVVVDADNQPLPSAQLVLKSGSKIAGFSMSGADGDYSLKLPATISDSTTLEVRYFGYAPKVFLAADLTQETLARIVIKEKGVDLKEVVVSAEALPQITKGDTISFQTDAYSDGSEDKIEDVIAKLPGVEVTEEGKITVNGKQLDRILVDGEDLFDKNYKLLSKNVPANLVTQIDVLSDYHPDELIGDLAGQTEMALNLKLDEDRKGFVFGEVNGELGNDSYRQASTNLFHFSKQVKLINFSDYSTRGYSSSSGAVIAGANGNAGSTIGRPVLSSPASRQRRLVRAQDYLRNNALGTAQSILFNLGPKVKNRLILNASKDRFGLQDNRLREVSSGQQVDSFNLQNDYNLHTSNLWLKNDLKIMIGKKSRLDFNTQIVGSRTRAIAETLATGSSLPEPDASETNLLSDPLGVQLTLGVVRRLNDNMALNLQGTVEHENYNQYQTYRGQVYSDIFNSRGRFGQRMNQRHSNQAFGATLLQQLGKNKLQYFVGAENKQVLTTTGLSDIRLSEEPTQLIRYQLNTYSSSVSWFRNVRQWTFNTGLTMAYYQFGEAETEPSISGPNNGVLAPKLSFMVKRKIGRRAVVSLSASNDQRPIGEDQAIPVPYLADQGTFFAGLDTNFLVRTQTVGLNYRYNNSFKQYGYGATINYNQTPNAVWNSYRAEDFIVVNRLSPGGGSAMMTASVDGNAYLAGIKTGIKVNASYFSFEDQVSFSTEPTTSNSRSISLSFRSTTIFTRWFKYSIRLNYKRFTNEVLSLSSSQKELFIGQKIILSPSKSIKSILTHDYYLPRLGTGQSPVQIISLSLDYNFLDGPFDVGFGINNLLNQGQITERSVTSYLRHTRTYSLRPRTVYFSARYKF